MFGNYRGTTKQLFPFKFLLIENLNWMLIVQLFLIDMK